MGSETLAPLNTTHLQLCNPEMEPVFFFCSASSFPFPSFCSASRVPSKKKHARGQLFSFSFFLLGQPRPEQKKAAPGVFFLLGQPRPEQKNKTRPGRPGVFFVAGPAACRTTKQNAPRLPPSVFCCWASRVPNKKNAPGVFCFLLGQPRELQKGVLSKKRAEQKNTLTTLKPRNLGTPKPQNHKALTNMKRRSPKTLKLPEPNIALIRKFFFFFWGGGGS